MKTAPHGDIDGDLTTLARLLDGDIGRDWPETKRKRLARAQVRIIMFRLRSGKYSGFPTKIGLYDRFRYWQSLVIHN